MTCTNQTDVSAYPWRGWGKITFNKSFVSKHNLFLFENCCLGEKSWQVVGKFEKFGIGEQKPPVNNLKHKHLALVTWLL